MLSKKIRLLYAILTTLIACLFCGLAFAQDAGSDSNWSGELTLALKGSDGNKQSTSTSVGLTIMKNADFSHESPYRHRFHVGYDVIEKELSDGEKVDTKDQGFLLYRLDYSLNDVSYVTGAATYYTDTLAGLDSFAALGAEYRHIVYQSDHHELKLMTGLAQMDVQYTDDEKIKGPSGMLGFDYKAKISNTLTFSQNAETYENSDLSYRIAKSALSYKLGSNSSVALTYELTYLSDVPEGKDTTDTTTNLKLKFHF